MDSWATFEDIWSNNLHQLETSCQQFKQPDNSDAEISLLKTAIEAEAVLTGVDKRFITAIMMQESKGCVRVAPTELGVHNPGIFQDHDGTGSCNDGNGHVQNPCPDSAITQMVHDGVGGTVSGWGLKQTIANSGATLGSAASYYRGARVYNSGSVAASGRLEDGIATHCYSSDVANRVLGWTDSISASKCAFDHAA